jgi:hypothetical protein
MWDEAAHLDTATSNGPILPAFDGEWMVMEHWEMLTFWRGGGSDPSAALSRPTNRIWATLGSNLAFVVKNGLLAFWGQANLLVCK